MESRAASSIFFRPDETYDPHSPWIKVVIIREFGVQLD